MILKIKKDNCSWLYIETESFTICSSCEPIKRNQAEDCYLTLEEPRKHIVIKREYVKEEHEAEYTLIVTDKIDVYCIDEFEGYVLNDKGQTVERL